MIVLVLGGARSGKSVVAEGIVRQYAGTGGVTYLATATLEGADPDFVARIAAHRARRPAHWNTVECGTALAGALAAVPDHDVVLVESTGTWVGAHGEANPDVAGLVAALRARGAVSVVVAEEAGMGVHPSSEWGRAFRDALGTVNTAIGAVADEALLVVAGRVLPLAPAPGGH